jgi:hypothetical protein
MNSGSVFGIDNGTCGKSDHVFFSRTMFTVIRVIPLKHAKTCGLRLQKSTGNNMHKGKKQLSFLALGTLSGALAGWIVASEFEMPSSFRSPADPEGKGKCAIIGIFAGLGVGVFLDILRAAFSNRNVVHSQTGQED